MGIGDEIMASGQARLMSQRYRRPVQIVSARGKVIWHPIWENNPNIVKSALPGHAVKLLNCSGHRPYIAGKSDEKWVWQRFNLVPGDIFLSESEKEFAQSYSDFVLVEPNVKGTNEGNKDWGWDRWLKFVSLVPYPLLQVGPPGTRVLPGVKFVETKDFRLAAAVLAVSRAFVGTEGALHHAAAALGVRAVVIFGGFISPDITGYTNHRNLFTGGVPCGMRHACKHCAQAMAKITPQKVADLLKEELANEERTRVVVSGPRDSSDPVAGEPQVASGAERAQGLPGEEATRSAEVLQEPPRSD